MRAGSDSEVRTLVEAAQTVLFNTVGEMSTHRRELSEAIRPFGDCQCEGCGREYMYTGEGNDECPHCGRPSSGNDDDDEVWVGYYYIYFDGVANDWVVMDTRGDNIVAAYDNKESALERAHKLDEEG